MIFNVAEWRAGARTYASTVLYEAEAYGNYAVSNVEKAAIRC